MRAEKQSRYPGIRAFEKEEQYLFFGREEETKRLYSQIKTQNLVVLFAKSGIGKSSLINASIEPLLGQELFYPVKIRFQNPDYSPVETFKRALSPFVDEALLNRHLPTGQVAAPWEYLRACRFEQDGKTLMPILILDQFEEFFDHSINDQNELTIELADMVSLRLPNRIQEQLRAIPFTKRSDEDLSWHSNIPIKILIAIRSDRIGLLDNLSAEIPGILQNRFQLKPLNSNSARHAIVEPALLVGNHFDTPRFNYSPAVLKKIIAGLSNSKGEIESFQLQLLCQYIEKQILLAPSENTSLTVTESFFKNENGFEAALNAILNNYYENELKELSEEERIKARKFIEEGLIIAGRRAGLSEGVEKERYQIDPPLLFKLLNSRLIRQENTHLGKNYEISHDTLVAPILASYEKRKFQEEKEARAIAAKKERRRLMSALGLALFGFSLAAISLLFYFQANEAKEVALIERERAEVALVSFREKQFESIEEQYKRHLSDGEYFISQNEFSEANDAFELAMQILIDFADEVGDTKIIYQIDSGGVQARKAIADTHQKEKLQSYFEQLIIEGDSLEERGEKHYIDAKRKFAAAGNLNFDNALARGKLYQISGKLEITYINFIKNGDIYFKAQGYSFALDNYKAALRIKPDNNYLKQKIKDCKRLTQ